MSAVRGIVDQLVRKRLWPVAVVLLAGLVAVPVLMLKGASPASSAPAPAPAAATAQVDPKLTSAPTPAIVPAATGGKERLLVGRAKNPFRPAGASGAADRPAGTAAPIPGAGTSTSTLPGDPAGSGAAGGASPGSPGSITPGGSGSTGTGEPASVPPAAPQPPATTTPEPLTKHVIGTGPYISYTVDLRFGRAGAGRKIIDPARLRPLGAPTNPVALFYGVFNRGRSAGFMLSASATAPSACGGQVTGCYLVHVRPGHSVRLAVGPEGPGQRHYDIEVLRITAVRTASYALALERQGRVSPIGTCLVSGGQSSGAIVFDARDGTFQSHDAPKECAKLLDGAKTRFSTVVDPGTAAATPTTATAMDASIPSG